MDVYNNGFGTFTYHSCCFYFLVCGIVRLQTRCGFCGLAVGVRVRFQSQQTVAEDKKYIAPSGQLQRGFVLYLSYIKGPPPASFSPISLLLFPLIPSQVISPARVRGKFATRFSLLCLIRYSPSYTGPPLSLLSCHAPSIVCLQLFLGLSFVLSSCGCVCVRSQ